MKLSPSPPSHSSAIEPLYFQLFDFTANKGDRRRLEILQAAFDCIAAEGVEHMTFEAVGKQIGVKPSHIAYYFPDKSTIVEGVFKLLIASAQKSYVEALKRERSPKRQLQSYVEVSFDMVKINSSFPAIFTLLFYFSTREEKYRDLYRTVLQTATQRVASILRPFYQSKPAKLRALTGVAEEIVTTLHGDLIQGSVSHDQSQIERIKKRSLKRLLAMAFTE